ncbi:MAG: lipase domain protein [Polyangiaceae bacterium]|jgi:lysophospholipase L1-like esterase|nr:lipase domain protein [Polyangiaceae bacterium]
MARAFTSLGMVLGAPLLGGCAAPPPSAGSASTARVEAAGGVCRFEEDLPPQPQPDGTWLVSARSRLIGYDGRVDCAAPGGPVLGFVGASVRVRFVGTGLHVLLKDFGRGTPQTTNFYDVTLDGGPPRLLEVSPDRERYELASGLAEGEHAVELFKRGEASPGGVVGAGKSQVLGFVLHGSRLLPVAWPERRLEFVGDSITCGYGNELSTLAPESEHHTSRRSNGHKAYGAVTAALLGARYSAMAHSGRGLSRNFAGSPGTYIPELYSTSVPDDPTAHAWDPTQYVPDAVIVNGGTNDYSTPGVDRAEFVRRYTEFLARLRGYYPEALLVAALGPMLNDGYPPGASAWSNARADVQAAALARMSAGDRKVRVVFFEPQTPPFGEDWHPTAATHAKMAEQLAPLLKSWLGW